MRQGRKSASGSGSEGRCPCGSPAEEENDMSARIQAPAPRSKRVSGFMKRFWLDRSANVAMMFGLSAIPVITASGAALDISRAMYVQSRLSSALDAAALAVGGMQGSDAELRAQAQRFFDANYPAEEIGTPGTLNVILTPSTVTLSASASLPTTLMAVVGIDDMDVNAEVEVTREMKGLELALVLDTTGSMADAGKMTALKQAGNDLISILFAGQETPEKVKVSVVPFSQAVRLDVNRAENRDWLDRTGQSSVARLNFDSNRYAWDIYPAASRLTHQLRSGNVWRGCVEARPNGLEYLDTPPTVGQPDTYWVPYFMPDSPDNNSAMHPNFPNNYIADGIANTQPWQTRHRRSAKYANSNNTGMHSGCDMQPILALTNTRTAIVNRINALNPSGLTHIAIGLGWGWRTLSPTAPFTEGAPFGQADLTKALVLMTDGVNTIGNNSTPLGSSYTAYGYLSQARLGSSNLSTALANMNADTATMCTRIKQQGIIVYSILLMEDDTTVRNLLRNCATDAQKFFDTPSGEQLRVVFRAIGAELSNLRISR